MNRTETTLSATNSTIIRNTDRVFAVCHVVNVNNRDEENEEKKSFEIRKSASCRWLMIQSECLYVLHATQRNHLRFRDEWMGARVLHACRLGSPSFAHEAWRIREQFYDFALVGEEKGEKSRNYTIWKPFTQHKLQQRNDGRAVVVRFNGNDDTTKQQPNVPVWRNRWRGEGAHVENPARLCCQLYGKRRFRLRVCRMQWNRINAHTQRRRILRVIKFDLESNRKPGACSSVYRCFHAVCHCQR